MRTRDDEMINRFYRPVLSEMSNLILSIGVEFITKNTKRLLSNSGKL